MAGAAVRRYGRLAASGAGIRPFTDLAALRLGSKAVWAGVGVEHRGDRIARLARPVASWAKAFLYAVVVALGMYTQPYVAFVAAAHLLWALRQKCFRFAFAGAALGALLFFPGIWYARGFWAQAVQEAGYRSSLTWTTPLMVARELSGAGYLLTVALFVLAVRGYFQTQMPNSAKRLLLLWIVVPVPLVMFNDSLFHYFFPRFGRCYFICAAAQCAGGRGARSVDKAWPAARWRWPCSRRPASGDGARVGRFQRKLETACCGGAQVACARDLCTRGAGFSGGFIPAL